MICPVARSATATPAPFPLNPCFASALEMPRASTASCVPSCAAAADAEAGMTSTQTTRRRGAQAPHQRNVMVMVCLPYTDARTPGIQMSIVAPTTVAPVSAATQAP